MPLRGVITFRAVTREGGVFWLSDEPMLLPELRKAVLEANLELVRKGLVLYTVGNASGISRQQSLVVIKPSGVPYERLRPADLVVTDLNGKIVEGKLRPSSDLPTHLVLYKSFPTVDGISHTHSEYATAWAQARRSIPCLGTTRLCPRRRILGMGMADRKSTRLNSSHRTISYAVFCLKKKTKTKTSISTSPRSAANFTAKRRTPPSTRLTTSTRKP